jgi:hypothetical protein
MFRQSLGLFLCGGLGRAPPLKGGVVTATDLLAQVGLWIAPQDSRTILHGLLPLLIPLFGRS